MSVLRNLNNSLIISIGISLILCGAIVYYCNSRLNNVEVAIMRQNQVLSSFIANVQNELRGGGGKIQAEVLSEDVSTADARASAINQENKIVVSDDDDSDSSSESDTESESESEVECAEESEQCPAQEIAHYNAKKRKDDNSNLNIKAINLSEILNSNSNNDVHHIKIVDIQDLSSMFMSEIKLDSLNTSEPTIYEINDDDDDSSESDDEDVTIIEVKSSDVDAKPLEIKLMDLKEIKIEPTDDISTNGNADTLAHAQTPLTYEQMRVDDLRKLVLEKNLATKDGVKKLKKPELLFLLLNPTTTF